ncbi:WD repeat and SOF domain-containing protein 1 [Thecamonas trahens ATCC 50062]|uniref:WD repeat and SOF domain-containing protein 1 n=1 Tax=Thecamonas trahens ATCC 50062 TaxID=461836 RepID=A0A0L0DW51_THETB|nr:WD repeat and SOF domain-containing protein 1 [Thecamonas trahens ATCC 50062]KNC56402.1 WD repeat and SOF domain-containing protein 1 [Thecamonas trahens ATCC 50062]|eukprot:XP_013760915.1 WD repeat and SOF domain-containing protein 1 [Thecamonas trahens ATCC 50062]
MKVKMISRDEVAMTRERSTDLNKVHRNTALRGFERQTEVKRAVNAAKLNRVFAKPFVGQLSGHMDTVTSMMASPRSLDTFLTGSGDGEVRVWSLSRKATLWSIPMAHTSFVTGLVVSPNGETFFTASDDRSIKQWRLDMGNMWAEDVDTPIESWASEYALESLSMHASRYVLATGSRQVDVWDVARATPVHTMAFSDDTISSVAFNQVETEIIAAASSDRSLSFYDIRTESALRKVELGNLINDVAWNPREAFNITIASDDHNLYTFDMRKLDRALSVHKDHVSAVMSVAYSPTGRSFVSGSYDRSIRLWNISKGHSHECYHTERMQRVLKVAYSSDARYVLSGSDDTGVRIWKSDASATTGIQHPRAKARARYEAALLKRYEHVPAVAKIHKQRFQPRSIFKARKLRHVMRLAEIRRDGRRRAHTRNPAPKIDSRTAAVRRLHD